jgi:murein DD-endopeptidase MepM/ murein hydrolase activator NlpD
MLKLSILSLTFFGLLSCAGTVPPLSVLGKWHSVEQTDTVESISQRYGVSTEEIAELNQIPSTGRIVGRERIFIPLGSGKPPGDGRPVKERPIETTGTEASLRSAVSQVAKTTSRSSSSRTGGVNGRKCQATAQSCFLWPVQGEVVQWFGKQGKGSTGDSDGINIKAPAGADVIAAANGEVLYSGDAIKGYGNLILLRHESNIITVYAHNRINLVKEGARVMRGEKIAEVGNSGAASESLLHFEVRVNEQPVDPTLYLPDKE